ncbi:MAG: glycoside hydrolase family 2 protein [Opitutaceae bacterium]
MNPTGLHPFRPSRQALRWFFASGLTATALALGQSDLAPLQQAPLYRTPRPPPRQLDLNGEWELASSPRPENVQLLASLDSLPSEGWINASVPGMVQWQLFRAGRIPHPYKDTNTKDLAWIEERAWWYRKTFDVPPAWNGRRVFLTFDGADYHTQVWFNGQWLGAHDGMFGGPDFDVTDRLKLSGNQIIVRILAAGLNKGRPADGDNVHSTGMGRIIKGDAYSRNISNPHVMTVGLWQPVRLHSTGAHALERPYLRTIEANEKSATLSLEVEVLDAAYSPRLTDLARRDNNYRSSWPDSNRELNEPVDLTLSIEIETGGTPVMAQVPIRLNRRRQWARAEISIPNPRLWWPANMGEPHLYPVTLRLQRSGTTLDTITFKHGIRTLQWSATTGPKMQDHWSNWRMSVNGRPLFVKGVNLMPIDLLTTEPGRYRWLLSLMRDCGIQMVRVNGSGTIEADVFFEICDELGIMVMSDFPSNFSWLSPDVPLDSFESQIVRNLIRLRTHPSLVTWTGGNEFPPYHPKNAAVVGIMERSVTSYDPERRFLRTSPDTGDVHPYPDCDTTWYLKTWRDNPAITEWGGHAMPTLSLLKQMLPSAELSTPAGLIKLDAAEFGRTHPILLHHWIEFRPDRFPRAVRRASVFADLPNASFADFCEAFQIGAGEIYETVATAFRANYPTTALVMPWNFNRPWPTIAMQMVDHAGFVVPNFYFVKRAYQPVSAALILPFEVFAPGETASIEASVTTEAVTAIPNSSLVVRVFDREFAVVAEKRYDDVVGGLLESKRFSFDVTAPDTPDSIFFIVAEVRAADGALLSRNIQWPRVLASFADQKVRTDYRSQLQDSLQYTNGPWLKPQAARQPTTLAVSAMQRLPAGRFHAGDLAARYDFTVTNTGRKPAFMVRLNVGHDALRAVFTDNYFWLNPGESRAITMTVRNGAGIGPFDYDAKDSVDAVSVAVDAWNAPPVAVAVSR